MDKFRSDYKTFYRKLRPFMNRLPSRFNKGYPRMLKNVKVISRILRPNDSAFRKSQEDMVVHKFLIVKELTLFVLEAVPPLVQGKYQAWFDAKGNRLRELVLLQMMAVGSLRLEAPTEVIEVLPSGIGGINSTVRSAIKPTVLRKLGALTESLKELTSSS